MPAQRNVMRIQITVSDVYQGSGETCCLSSVKTVMTAGYSETYSVNVRGVIALVIQRAKRMRRIILSSVACPALAYFPTLSPKLHDF